MRPISKRMFGAVLFADISGFTRLSARLDSEELKLHIK
jgi:class 3 adenylate cyclase